ncbi:MAG: 16S rRNA (uracil(1498)-N(3))-methyltransferase [Rhodanobacteraceae bacterium]
MREVRLFIDAPLEPGCELRLPASAARHALRVLRLKVGDRVTLFNGDGRQYVARLLAGGERHACARIDTVAAPERESALRLTLVQALARGEKMDWVVQKATELGAVSIVPVVSTRSEVRLDAVRGEKRVDRWRAIAIAACEQSGRNVLPKIAVPLALEAFLAADTAPTPAARWVLQPGQPGGLRSLGALPPAMTIAVGPEGGFDDGDLSRLRAADYRELTLGPRILRTETAGIAALAALQAVYGDL